MYCISYPQALLPLPGPANSAQYLMGFPDDVGIFLKMCDNKLQCMSNSVLLELRN